MRSAAWKYLERPDRITMLAALDLVFSKWDQIFKDPMTTAAAIDRVVHHAVVLEFTGPSVRAEEAAAGSSFEARCRTPGRSLNLDVLRAEREIRGASASCDSPSSKKHQASSGNGSV